MCVNVAFLTHFRESTLQPVLVRSQPIFNFVKPWPKFCNNNKKKLKFLISFITIPL